MNLTVTPIVSADVNSAGQSIEFPRANAHVTAEMYDVPPGTSLPVHKHPFPRLGYILAGTLRVTNAETGRSQTYGPGAFVLEAVDQWHEGINPGGTSLKLLVIDLAEKDAETTVLKR